MLHHQSMWPLIVLAVWAHRRALRRLGYGRVLGEAIKSVSCDNGMGIPPEIKEKLFQPFSITLFAEPAPRSASATVHERHALLD